MMTRSKLKADMRRILWLDLADPSLKFPRELGRHTSAEFSAWKTLMAA